MAQLIGRLIILMMSVKAFVEIRLDMRIAQAFFFVDGIVLVKNKQFPNFGEL